MTEQEILCRWAEQEFGLGLGDAAVVEIKDGYDGGYSTYTPGIGDYTEISVYDAKGRTIALRRETETPELIVSVCRFAAGLSD